MSDHRMSPLSDAVIQEVRAKLGTHSIFAPSASHRWLLCPGSLVPGVLADDSAGYEAAEGTVGHSVAEEWLLADERPDHLVGTKVVVEEPSDWFVVEITTEMLDHLEKYVSLVWGQPGEHHTEQRVDFSDLTPIPDQGGTADYAICAPGVLRLVDLKYGKGVRVDAAHDMEDPRTLILDKHGNLLPNGNPQLLLYAYGFFRKWDHKYHFEEIVIEVAQPRMDNWPVWRTTRAELLRFAEWVKERADLAWRTDAPRHPDPEACRFCPIKSDCTAFLVETERMLDGLFDDIGSDVSADEMLDIKGRIDRDELQIRPVDPASLTTAQMARLLPWRPAIERWFSDLEESLERRAIDGAEVPGYKLVEGRSFRVYRDERKVAANLEFMGLELDVIYKKTLISPAQAEEALRKAGFRRKDIPALLEPLVRRPAGKATLAPAGDRRQAIKTAIGEVFDDLDAEI